MQRISFHSPTSVDEVCELLAERPEETRVLAGGQSLIQMLKQRLVAAETIVDISSLDELTGIRRDDDRIWIGAGETYATVRDHALVREHLPVLPDVLSTIGDAQIRNRGTLVGGIVHADPQGDPPVVATALDATIRIRSVDHDRSVSARNFYQGLFTTDLESTELVTEVGFPIADDRSETFQSFTPRQGDYAVASVVASTLNGDSAIDNVEFTVGAVGDHPQFVNGGDLGLAVTEELPEHEAVGGAVANSIRIEGDEEWSPSYKRRLVEHLVSEALTDLGVGT